jgi:hypothetical protein
MIDLKYCGALLLMGTSLALANAPTPGYAVSSGYVGIDQGIQVNGQDGYQTAGGGGQFQGTLSNSTLGSSAASFWCVDDQEAFYFGESGLANITLLSNTATIDSASTHYGTVLNSTNPNNPGQWLNTGAIPGYSTSLATENTAADRFTLAAYLVTQYPGFDTSITGNTTAAQNEADAIQQAIWAITNTTLTSADYAGIYENNYRSVSATTGALNVDSSAYWIDQAISNASRVNRNGWAVVSWGASPTGTLNTGGYADGSNSTNQTFLVELTGTTPLIPTGGGQGNTPEPSFYGALTVGLASMIFAVRRRKKA